MYNFENLKKFEPYGEVEHFEYPKANEIFVVKIDTDKYNLEDANIIYEKIINQLPAGCLVMGLPKGVELEIWDKYMIDAMIKELEMAKEKLQ